MPTDASAEAQAVAVLGGAPGALSALQIAIRHPGRVSAHILLVPLPYKPQTEANSAPPTVSWAESLMMTVIGSDFLFWSGMQLSRGVIIDTILATPPGLLTSASAAEKARIDFMLNNILPVSARAAGLRIDSAVGGHLVPSSLYAVRTPTLIIARRDAGYGTYVSAALVPCGLIATLPVFSGLCFGVMFRRGF